MKDKVIAIKRAFESGQISWFEAVRESYHLFEEQGHKNMENRKTLQEMLDENKKIRDNPITL